MVALDRMRWNSSGNSAGGRSAYFSASRIMRILDDVQRRVVVPNVYGHGRLKARLSAL